MRETPGLRFVNTSLHMSPSHLSNTHNLFSFLLSYKLKDNHMDSVNENPRMDSAFLGAFSSEWVLLLGTGKPIFGTFCSTGAAGPRSVILQGPPADGRLCFGLSAHSGAGVNNPL